MTMATNAYCTTCHEWVTHDSTPSGRHEHQPVTIPKWGTEPAPGSDQETVLDAMREGPVIDTNGLGSMAWWSAWDLTDYTGSLCSRDHIGALKRLGWTIDERWVTSNGKRHKQWRLVLPRQTQGGLF